MNKKVSVSMLITTVIIAMTVTFSITMVVAMRLFDSTVASVKQKESMYSKIAEIDKYVRGNDYFEIDETTLYDTIASGYLLGTGDRYARYYTAAAYSELLDIQNGKLVGIGVELVKDSTTGYAKITKVYPGSPAADLGLEKGCYITSIDETDVKTISSTESIAARLRGESGTTAALKWFTPLMEEKEATLTRRSYTTTTVDYSLVNDSYGYIRISQFDDTTASELDYAISSMTAAGASSLVFDLRDNAGGVLDSAVECINLLCPESDIALIQYKNGSTEVLGRSEGEKKTELPIVCLVNGNTASAAELFAYSVRALNGARLVGETTMGKGTVQSSPQRMSDGSAVVITVGKLLTCDGESFDGVGLTVDVERVLSADEQTMYYDYTVENDPQIQRAFAVADSLTGSSTVASGNSASGGASSAASGTDGEGASSEASAEGENAVSSAAASGEASSEAGSSASSQE